jgi:hypothetical protein
MPYAVMDDSFRSMAQVKRFGLRAFADVEVVIADSSGMSAQDVEDDYRMFGEDSLQTIEAPPVRFGASPESCPEIRGTNRSAAPDGSACGLGCCEAA